MVVARIGWGRAGMTLGVLGFVTPWLLVGLVALPLLWLILRAIPPAPVRRLFPGVVLLLGLQDQDSVTDRTPWWLLLLRMLLVAAAIIGLAGPVLNPNPAEEADAQGQLLLVFDGSWAGGSDWTQRLAHAQSVLDTASRTGRKVALLRLSTPEPVVFQSAATLRSRLSAMGPMPWLLTPQMVENARSHLPAPPYQTQWYSDGVDYPGKPDLITDLQSAGDLRVFETDLPRYGMLPVEMRDGVLHLSARRTRTVQDAQISAVLQGRDPVGNRAQLARVPLNFSVGQATAKAEIILPAELQTRMTHAELEIGRSAGSVALADDGLRRREVALVLDRDGHEGLELLSPLHYLRQALSPNTDLIEGAVGDLLPANPDVVVMADTAKIASADQAELLKWVGKGGMLIRFAGPRLAASDVSRTSEDPLLPVRLRAGGRMIGGAMSWGAPKALAPFAQDSPFRGIEIPADVVVSAQVMAQPDPVLASRVIAQLADGTPLVTRKKIGAGAVVLFHVTANAEWSTLPLSGLFVSMIDRLVMGSGQAQAEDGDLAGTRWQPQFVLDGLGQRQEANNLPGVDGQDLRQAPLGPELRPGIYASGNRMIARNAMNADIPFEATVWPSNIPVEGVAERTERALGGWFLSLALILLVLDILATLALSGRLRGARAMPLAMLGLLAVGMPDLGQAQSQSAPLAQSETRIGDGVAIAGTSELVLAHVITGDNAVDTAALAGLRGLSDTLFFRTSVEPGAPVGIDLERDQLAFHPFLYWPITPGQAQPSAAAYDKLNRYLQAGGMILFDTRDANVAGFGASSPNGRKLQALAAPLSIPPLEPVPEDHVVTRAFYLLQDFPGRHLGRDLWVEAAPPDAEQIEGMPFRNLNDGVTPVVIGGNDWAAAWALDRRGNPMYPIGRGYAGERQRELAFRFGVNLIMHVLTGNYKSDQVHVPALLDRLGQ